MQSALGVGYVVDGCNVQYTCYTEHGRYGLSSCLYAELWSSCAVMGLYSMYGIWTVYVGVYVMLQNFIATEHSIGMDQWKTGVNNAEYLLHLVCTNRLCACRDVV